MLTAAVLTSPPDGTTVEPDTAFAWTPSARVAPVAAITSPAPGSSYVEGTEVALTGSVTDALGGAVVGAWSSSLDGALGSGNSLSLTTLSVGAHVLTYGGTDSQGDAATPVTVSVTITAAPALPTVALVAPADGASVLTGAPVLLAATATNATGVTFSVDGGGALAGTWNEGAGRWEGSYTPATSRAYSFTATATGAGGSASSLARTFTASAAPTAPTVTLVSPAAGASVIVGVALTLAATATDATAVSFSVNGGAAIPAAFAAGQWSASYTPGADGSFSWTATATGTGGSVTSAARSFTAEVLHDTYFDEGAPVAGADVVGWAQEFVAGGVTHTYKNRGGADGFVMRSLTTTNARRAARFAAAGTMTDGEVLCLLRAVDVAGPTTRCGVIVRGSGAAAAENGYRTSMLVANKIQIAKYAAGATSTLTADIAYPWAANTDHWHRVRFQGTSLKVKFWARGTAEPEAWTWEGTDPSNATGWVGTFTVANGDQEYTYFAALAGAGTIPVPPI